jgi:bacteriophage N4 adsorption protein B
VDGGVDILWRVAHELTLFAAVAFLVGGIADVLLDLVWIGRAMWRRWFVFRVHARADVGSLKVPTPFPRFAIFIPAWDESVVIAPMLRHLLSVLREPDWRVYVGIYPNDTATRAAAETVRDARISLVSVSNPGPTTKADCLNSLWQAMRRDEAGSNRGFAAIVLHDAEDVVHRDELRVFAALLSRFDLIQLPVLPLIDPQSRWIGGHYIDEFATHHSRTIVTREAIGAGIPSAGVGCAIACSLLERIAAGRSGPFDADSLTEDYELGLRVREIGGRGAFVRIPAGPSAPVVAVRAHFPGTLAAAVTQKSRWIAGIALAGWDRLGWRRSIAENWMRLNDRRPLLAALTLLCAYAALLLNGVLWLMPTAREAPLAGDALGTLVAACTLLMLWRLTVRAALVTRVYGWREGLRSVPRALLGNVIDMMAARRAVSLYRAARRNGRVSWDKTAHRFPEFVV